MGRVHHLHCFTPDHRPLLLALDPNGESHKWRRKPFRFEAMWIMDPGCGEIVSRAWAHQTEGTPMFQATQKLRKCKKLLKKWSRAQFGNVKQQIKQTKEKLWQAEVASTRDGKDDEVVRLKVELNYVRKKSKCGIKDQGYNGFKVVIEIPSFFMGQQLKGSEKISLRGLGIVKGDGRQRRAFTQKYLWTSVLICSQHPILTTLIALWNRDDNFFPLCLTRPSPLRPAWVFPPCKGNGAGMGARF